MLGKHLKPFVLVLGLLWIVGFAFLVGEGTQQQNERIKIEAAQKANNAVKKQEQTQGGEAVTNGPSPPQTKNGGNEGTEITFTGLRLGEAVLAFITVLLWLATRDLVRTSRDTAQQQLRAFVFAKGFQQAINIFNGAQSQFIKEYVFWSRMENVGLTPATDVKVWIQFHVLSTSTNKEPHFVWSDTRETSVIGPRGTGQTAYLTIATQTMIALWERKVEIYLATRIEYRDIFDVSIVHHHEQCAMLDLVRHPADVETGPEAEKNLPRVTMRTYGPQNTVA